MSAAEVDEALAKEPRALGERFRSQLASLPTYPAVRLTEVRESADRVSNNASAPALQDALQGLTTVPAYRALDLAALARRHDIVADEPARTRLHQLFSGFITGAHVSRSALLSKIDRLDWAAPPTAATSPMPDWVSAWCCRRNCPDGATSITSTWCASPKGARRATAS